MPAKVPRRHPFEWFCLIICAVAGFGILSGLSAPNSITESLAAPLRLGWGVILFTGGVLALTGVFKRSGRGVLLEQLGLTIVAGGAVVYFVAAVSVNGIEALFPAGITLGFGLACGARVRQIQQQVIHRADQ